MIAVLAWYASKIDNLLIKQVSGQSYTYGNTFSTTTYTTAYADYLNSSFTLSMWVAINTQSPDSTDTTLVYIYVNNCLGYFLTLFKDVDYPTQSQLTFGLSAVDSSTYTYNPYLKIADTSTSNTFTSSSSNIQFSNSHVM